MLIRKVSNPVNPSEARAISYLKVNLPDSFRLIHNFEIVNRGQHYEIDMLLISPHRVFVIDVKGSRGTITTRKDGHWSTEKDTFPSPLTKFRNHAKVIKTLLELELGKAIAGRVWVQGTVLMTAKDSKVSGPFTEVKDIVYLSKGEALKNYFESDPDRSIITDLQQQIEDAIVDKASPAPLRYEHWNIVETIRESENGFAEYIAENKDPLDDDTLGVRARLRLYDLDLYAPPAAQLLQRRLHRRAYEICHSMGYHENILQVKEFFRGKDDDLSISVLEDFAGEALDKTEYERFSLENKLSIIRQVLRALDFAHSHGAIHRNLTPASILLKDGLVKITPFDFGKAGGVTIGPLIKHLASTQYQPRECQLSLSDATERSDLFSAGLIFFELLTEELAFDDFLQMMKAKSVFPKKPSEINSRLSEGLDKWLQTLCAFSADDRFATANAALEALEGALQSWENLSPGFVIGNRYMVVRRLGEPGAYAATYLVKEQETNMDIQLVLKLATTVNCARMRKEHDILLKLKGAPGQLGHTNITKLSHFEPAKDKSPSFCVFEYVPGKSLELLLVEKETLSVADVIKLAKEAGSALLYMHNRNIFHLDIKPANMLISEASGALTIIDFNIAVNEFYIQESSNGLGITPPDWQPSIDPLSLQDRDLYALGYTLYRCLTGLAPALNAPMDPRSLDKPIVVSEGFARLLMKMISPKKTGRFPSTESFLKDLYELHNSAPVAWPQTDDYRAAFEPLAPRLKFSDPILQNGKVHKDYVGARSFSLFGNFVCRIDYDIAGQIIYGSWAAKCFVGHDPNRDRRCRTIVDTLKNKLKLTHFPSVVEYRPEGVQMGGVSYPVMIMNWLSGETLDKYIEKKRRDSKRLFSLADQLRKLHRALNHAGIAHGDLQPQNILVNEDGCVQLVDLDGMFVPGLEGLQRVSEGWNPNFQHPDTNPIQPRSNFDATMDNFSAWLLYGSVLALSLEPDLELGKDYLLLSAADFNNPRESLTLQQLLLHSLPDMKLVAKFLQHVLSCRLSDVPGLDIPEEFRGILQVSTSQPSAVTLTENKIVKPSLENFDANFHTEQGDNHFKNQDYVRSIEEYTEAIEINASFALAYHKRGIANFELGAREEAITDFTHALTINSKCSDHYYYRGIAYSALGNEEKAIEDFTRALEYENDSAVKRCSYYLSRAESRMGLKDWEGGLSDCTDEILAGKEDASSSFRACLIRTTCYYELNLWTEAVANFYRLIEIDPTNQVPPLCEKKLMNAYLGRARVCIKFATLYKYSSLGDFQTETWCDLERLIRDDCSLILHLETKNIEAHRIHAEFLCALRLSGAIDDDWFFESISDEEINEYSAILAIAPGDRSALLGRAWLHWNTRWTDVTGRMESAVRGDHAAISDYSALLAFEPDNYDALKGRADVRFLRTLDWEKALEDYTKAIETNPGSKDCLQAHFGRAEILARLGHDMAAIEEYSLVLSALPDDNDTCGHCFCFRKRALIYERIGNYADAGEDYTAIISIGPPLRIAYVWRAYAREQCGDWAGALHDYEKILQLDLSPSEEEQEWAFDWDDDEYKIAQHQQHQRNADALHQPAKCICIYSTERHLTIDGQSYRESHGGVYAKMARLYSLDGRRDLAFAQYSRAIDEDGWADDWEFHYNRGCYLRLLGDTTIAIQEFGIALQLFQEWSEKWHECARYTVDFKNPRAAFLEIANGEVPKMHLGAIGAHLHRALLSIDLWSHRIDTTVNHFSWFLEALRAGQAELSSTAKIYSGDFFSISDRDVTFNEINQCLEKVSQYLSSISENASVDAENLQAIRTAYRQIPIPDFNGVMWDELPIRMDERKTGSVPNRFLASKDPLLRLAGAMCSSSLAANSRIADKPELVVQAHQLSVWSVAFSPDGKTLASSTYDDTIMLWDVDSLKLLRTLTGHSTNSVCSVVFSPDGKTIATGSDDSTVKLWDATSGQLLINLPGHSDAVKSVAFSPDGKTIATGSDDSTVKLRNAATGQVLLTLTGHLDAVGNVAFSPDGKTLSSASQDATTRLWDVTTGKELHRLNGQYGLLSFSPDGKMLATAGTTDEDIMLWDPCAGKALGTLTGHRESIAFVSFSPDGKTLVSASEDNEGMWMWDVASRKQIWTVTGRYSSIAFSPDGKTLASGGNSSIKLWQVSTGKELQTLGEVYDNPNGVAFSLDGLMIKSGGRVWDTVIGEVRQDVCHVGDFSPDGKTFACHLDNAIELSENDVRDHTTSIRYMLTGPWWRVNSVKFSPDGDTLALSATHIVSKSPLTCCYTIELWDAATGKQLRTLRGHSSDVSSLAFSPDSQTIASSGKDGTIKLWAVVTGKERFTWVHSPGYSYRVNSVAFSPDGKMLVSGNSDKTIGLWNTATGNKLRTLTGHTSDVNSVTLSPDGKMLASGSSDKTIKLWDASTGKELHTLTGHTSAVNSVAFSPDSETIASGSYDKTIKLWDRITGIELASLYSFGDADWAVVTKEGRFDASPAGEAILHWRVNNQVVELAQYRNEFYERGLLRQLLGLEDEDWCYYYRNRKKHYY